MTDATDRRRHATVMALAIALGIGATVGDIGSCGQRAELLDASTFFLIKAGVDCDRCRECGIASATCDRTCTTMPSATLPVGCRPLVHDGEVCLRALIHASCSDYASYVSDTAPTAPSECQFCPAR